MSLPTCYTRSMPHTVPTSFSVHSIAVTVSGEITDVDLECTATGSTLEALYRTIGCQFVDVVHLGDGIDMWVDDEGLHISELNPLASFIASTYGFTAQPYFGNVVFAAVDRIGETVSLSADQMALLHRAHTNGAR